MRFSVISMQYFLLQLKFIKANRKYQYILFIDKIKHARVKRHEMDI
jgi:hypothetical protein